MVRVLVVCVAAGVGVPLVCLAIAPFHTLTHEFTSLFTVLTAGLFYFVSAGIAMRAVAARGSLSHLTAASKAFWRSAFLAGVTAFLALAVMATANAAFFGCRIWLGLPYFGLTWAPAMVLALAAGCVFGALGVGRRMRIGVLVTAIVLSLVHDGLQLYFGPRVYPVDFLLGDLGAFTQRGGMAPSTLHLYQRVFVLVCASFVWDMGRWRLGLRAPGSQVDIAASSRMARDRALLTGAVVAGLAIFAGSFVGIGVGRGRLHRAYGQTELTEHFEIHYSQDSRHLGRLDEIKRNAEWDWHYLTELWGIEPAERVRLYLFESGEELHTYTGLPNAHAGLGEVFIDYESARRSTLLHELTHALHKTLRPSPLILLSRGMLEGTAMAFEEPYTSVPEAHEFEAAAFQAGKLPSAKSFMSILGFSRNAEGAAYQSAGSFLGFLVFEYGFEKFHTLQQTFSFVKAYGKDIDELDGEWRDFLAAVPVRPDILIRASRFFDLDEHPSYYAAECPKVGKVPRESVLQAELFWAQGAFEEAGALYEGLYEDDAAVRWTRWAVRCREKEEDYLGALAILDGAAGKGGGKGGLKDFERAALMADRIRLLVKARDWPALYEAYEKRAEEDLGVGAGNRMGEACLREPNLRERYAELFTEENVLARDEVWRTLHEEWPDFEPLLFLYATAGLRPDAPMEKRAEALLDAARRSQEMADMVAPRLHSLYKEAIGAKEYGLASSMCEALAQWCGDGRYRFYGDLGRRRIEFETGALSQ